MTPSPSLEHPEDSIRTESLNRVKFLNQIPDFLSSILVSKLWYLPQKYSLNAWSAASENYHICFVQQRNEESHQRCLQNGAISRQNAYEPRSLIRWRWVLWDCNSASREANIASDIHISGRSSSNSMRQTAYLTSVWGDELFDSTIAMNTRIIHDDHTPWSRKETA